MERPSLPVTVRVLGVLLASSFVSAALLGVRMLVAGNMRFNFLLWNLFLAWLPLLFALGLRLNLTKKPWLSWQNIGLSICWLGFLPNSFYIISDLIHLQSSGETYVLYDVAMLMSFVINGLILGYISTYIVHSQLSKRLNTWQTNTAITFIFLCCGFAIYLGRYLRWNTWDILVNPAGLLFDLSERVINPIVHLRTYTVTLVFTLILASTYWVICELIGTLGKISKEK